MSIYKRAGLALTYIDRHLRPLTRIEQEDFVIRATRTTSTSTCPGRLTRRTTWPDSFWPGLTGAWS